jgi:hypothetical protein
MPRKPRPSKAPAKNAYDKERDAMRRSTASLLLARAERSTDLDIPALITRLKADTSGPAEEWKLNLGIRLLRNPDAWPMDVESIMHRLFMDISASEVPRFLAEFENQWRRRLEQRENGELLAPAGREKIARLAEANREIFVQLYRSVRPSFPTGRMGNAEALRTVAERHQRRTGRKAPVHIRTVRNALKKAGIACG